MRSIHYIRHRLSNFLWLFLAVEALVRLVFLVREHGNGTLAPFGMLKALLVGAAFDFSVFLYFAVVYALYLLLLPREAHGGKGDLVGTRIWLFLFGFTLMFTSVSEWFFWDEFAARFNFIAVDYLVYTHEVIANIRESYPIVPLVAGMAVLAGLLSWAMGRRSIAATDQRPGSRALGFLAVLLLALGGYAAMNSDYADITENRYTDEAAKNGFYELFAAFWHNELRYDRFYATGDASALHDALAQELGGAPENPRSIRPGGKEIHPNIVLITVESLSASFMATFGDTHKLTPNLDALADHSLFFSNLYATGTRTVYGLSSLSLGIPPLPGNSIVRRPQNDGLFSLASVLNRKGYISKFLYGGYGYFDNMNKFFAGNGYQIVDRKDLAPDEMEFANAWGVADEFLFRRVGRENDRAYAEGKPFFDMVMTTSNHRPFTYPDGRIDLPSKSGRHGAVKYTDYAIAQFLKESASRPWFKNTIFVVVADHTAGSAGKAELDPAGYHIPLFIYAPGIVAPKKVDTLMSQIDILPTLLGLMHMQYESKFWGKDALRTPPHRAFISNYQQLGYLTDDQLLVLKPVKRVDYFRKKNGVFEPESNADDALLQKALSYYQNASNWREWNADLPH